MAGRHFDLRELLRNPAPLGEAVGLRPIISVAGVGFGVHELEIRPRPDAQTVAFDAPLYHGRPPHQDQPGEALVHHHLSRAQRALVLALGKYDPTPRTFFGRVEDRLHDEARVIDELKELVVVRVESAIGRVAAPEAMAALATAGASFTIRRGAGG